LVEPVEFSLFEPVGTLVEPVEPSKCGHRPERRGVVGLWWRSSVQALGMAQLARSRTADMLAAHDEPTSERGPAVRICEELR
jgi:hypothetical protein